MINIIKEHLAILSPTYLEVIDESYKHVGHVGAGKDGHYFVKIASNAFQGYSKIKQHQVIYSVLEKLIGKDKGIHALKIQVLEIPTP